jgi:glycosyltransferase involved in cell wall biosynthesis
MVQIDGGPHAQEIYAKEFERLGFQPEYRNAPSRSYWERWYAECTIADTIVVNSEWTKTCLQVSGINVSKVRIVPLAYDAPKTGSLSPSRSSVRAPSHFSKAKPLQVVYVGQVSLEKGISRLVEAARLLQDTPIQFRLIGRVAPEFLSAGLPGNVTFVGAVPRAEVPDHLSRAHLFVFPTLSDGFGMAQLEAQASGLPIVATPYCGDVVIDHVNGLRLHDATVESIAAAFQSVVDYPNSVQSMSRATQLRVPQFSLAMVQRKWREELRRLAN